MIDLDVRERVALSDRSIKQLATLVALSAGNF